MLAEISVELANKDKPILWVRHDDDEDNDRHLRISKAVANALIDAGVNHGG